MKRYRLLKEVLNTTTGHIMPIGEVFEQIADTRKYTSKNGWWMAEASCLKKDWFEEVTEPVNKPLPENNGVQFLDMYSCKDGLSLEAETFLAGRSALIRTNVPIPEDKYPAIKKAIIAALNGEDTVVEGKCVFDAERINERIKHIEELEEAFKAGRELWADEFAPPETQLRYHTFRDYCIEKSPSYLKPQWNPPPEKTDTVVEDKPQYISFDKLELSQHDKIERAASFIGLYRHDHTMTNHRIAHSLLYPTNTMNAYTQPKEQDTAVLPEAFGNLPQCKDKPLSPVFYEHKQDTDTKVVPEWEIISFYSDMSDGRKTILGLCTDGNYKYGIKSINFSASLEDCLKSYQIHSVRRLSDNEVLTIGSKEFSYGKPCKILSFRVMENGCMWCCVEFENGNKYENANILSLDKLPTVTSDKVSTNNDKPVLFTTEDGVDVVAGQKVTYVLPNFETKEWTPSEYDSKRGEYLKYFSTKEAAEQYISENKPCLSLKEVKDIINDYAIYTLLEKYVNQKLKNK